MHPYDRLGYGPIVVSRTYPWRKGATFVAEEERKREHGKWLKLSAKLKREREKKEK